jgi:hypothetical protein
MILCVFMQYPVKENLLLKSIVLLAGLGKGNKCSLLFVKDKSLK